MIISPVHFCLVLNVAHFLSLDLRADSDVPLHRQIYQQIRQAILTGRVRSQQKLPASRQLALSLGVSRSTVVQSYDQLISEGYLKPRRGAGTFVCAVIPDELLAVSGDTNGRTDAAISSPGVVAVGAG
ncbi:MAG: winged helix-turn-helix domain-containing protein [Cyanobacteria bacterium J06573_11]